MTHEKPKILIVDDRVENIIALERTLSDLDVDFVRATSGNDALIQTLEHDFAIALVDVQMADMDGFETVAFMRQEKKTRHLPVIFISAIYKEDFYQIKGIQTGAVDFITKPIVPEILIGKVQIFLELYQKEQRLKAEIDRRITYENALAKSEAKQIRLNRRLREKLEELSASEERFKSLVLTIPDIVYRIDREGRFTYVNEAIERLGYESKDLIGAHFSEIVFPEDVDRISRKSVLPKYEGLKTGDKDAPKLFDERRTGNRRTIGLEVRLLTKTGNFREAVMEDLSPDTVVVEINSAGLYGIQDEDQKHKIFIGTVGVIRDISERKAQETRIRRHTRLLDGINQVFREALTCDTLEAVASISLDTALELTQSRFGFLGEITDQGRFIAHAVSKSGWQSCQIQQEKATALLANMEIRGLWGSVLKTGQSLLTNAPATHPAAAGVPEGHPSITTFLGVPLMQGEAVLGMVALANKETHYHENDRSAVESLAVAAVEALNRKRAEIDLKRHRENLESLVEERTAALKASQAQLIQAEKTRALGTMVAGVAHELNNPLTGMLQFTEYCIRHAQDAHRIHDVLQDIEHETKRCIRIVGDLLTFSRSEKSEKEAFQKTDLQVLIDRVVRLLSYRIEKEGVSLVCHVAEEARQGWIMPEPFQQVIMNLLTNALDAVADRGQKEIQARVALAGENIRISVSDTGCGMSDDTLDKIFDPFFTTKPIGKGTGLGLSISKSIVDAHRGEISCTSAPEKGSVFTVVLPAGKDSGLTIDD